MREAQGGQKETKKGRGHGKGHADSGVLRVPIADTLDHTCSPRDTLGKGSSSAPVTDNSQGLGKKG